MSRYILLALLSLMLGTLAAQPILSCYDIQYTMEPDGNSPYLDQVVTVQGIVSGTGFNNSRYFITDAAGGPWSGLYIYNNTNHPNIGDLVQITGMVDEYYNLTEITTVSSFQVLSTNNALPQASVISTATLSAGPSAEAWESVLVQVQNASVMQIPNAYQEFYVSDGSGECQIDNGFFPGSHTWENIQTGVLFSSITGIVDFTFSIYAINPRSISDMVMDGAAVSLRLPSLTAAVDAVITLPMEVHNLLATQGYNDYSFELFYDPAILQYQNVFTAGTISQTGTVSANSSPGNLSVSYLGTNLLQGSGTLLNFSFLTLRTGRSDLNLSDAVFGTDPITHLINGSVTVNGNYNTLGDTLSVIQKPLLNIPAIHIPGETLSITCLAAQNTTGFEAWLLHANKRINLSLQSATWHSSPERWELQVTIPPIAVFELYDLEVNANGGIHDITRNAVQLIPSRKDNYYFVHITDLHLPNRMFYPNPGYDTDSTSVVDFRAVMDDINLIRPEFVLITGDLINEGELENFSNQFWFGWTQKILTEFEVPVYVTSGNHDIGGWNSTPPPSGSSRKNWWRYFGWQWLDNADPNWPYHTQDYSFTYNNTLYVGLEAYNNYDNYRPNIYGSDSFTNQQLAWLNNTLAEYPSHRKVLFHHYDFQGQLALENMGIDMALYGHIHSNSGSISYYPYNLATRSVCDGNRAYRVVRVSNANLSPQNTIYAGSSGANLNISYLPANNAVADSVMATLTNNQSLAFENTMITFKMPASTSGYDVVGGLLEQVDRSGDYNVCYVRVNLGANSVKHVSISANGVANEDATLIPLPVQIKGVHPNPLRAVGELDIHCDKAFARMNLELYNIRGQKVGDFAYDNLKVGTNRLPIRVDLNSGIYFIRIKDLPAKAHKLVIINL